MIKTITNKTNEQNITIESKFVINKQTVSTVEKKQMSTNDLLFVKLKFNGLETEDIASVILKIKTWFSSSYEASLVAIKCNSTDISNSNIINISNTLTGNEDYVEVAPFRGTLNSFNGKSNGVVKLDITNLIKYINTNKELMIGIKLVGTSSISLSSPQKDSVSNEVVSAKIVEKSGFNFMHEFDTVDPLGCGAIKSDLTNGEVFYVYNPLKGVKGNIPLDFTIIYNKEVSNIENLKTYFLNKFIPNYYYSIKENTDNINIKDYLGTKKYYDKIDKEDEELLESLKIKHTDQIGDLYYCALDFSYFYKYNINNRKYIKLYDKKDNLTEFEILDDFLKILKVTTKHNKQLNFYYNDEDDINNNTKSNIRLKRIVNDKQDEMVLYYNTNGYINKVDIPSIQRKVEFTETLGNIRVKEIYYNPNATQYLGSFEILKDFSISLTENTITQIKNEITMYKTKLNYSDDKIQSVEILNGGETRRWFYNQYAFSNKHCEVKDIEGNKLFYHFDEFGNLKTIEDDKCRFQTYNYAKAEYNEKTNLIAKSNVENHSRNLLENNGFELNNIFENSCGWKINNTSNINYELVDDRIVGAKALLIKPVSNTTTLIYQDIVNPKPGNYYLSGYIKHKKNILTNNNLKIKLKGSYFINTTSQINKESTLEYDKEQWYKFKISNVTIPENATNITLRVEIELNNCNSEIYLDGLQLSINKESTRDNLIENGYMEHINSNNRAKGWEYDYFSTNDRVVSLTDDLCHSNLLGEKVFKIESRNPLTYTKKKMYQKINIKGIKNDEFIFSVLGKCLVSDNITFQSYVKFEYEDGTFSKELRFDFDKHYENWQIVSRSVVAEKDYKSITVGVIYDGSKECYLDAFQLYQGSFGRYYNYDKRNKLIEVIDNNKLGEKYVYDDKERIVETITRDGSYLKYSYDTKDRLNEIRDIKNNKVKYEYDEDNNKVKKVTIEPSSGEKIIRTIIYDSNKELYIDEYGYLTETEKDYLERITKIKTPDSLEKTYVYNNKSELFKLTASQNNSSVSNTFTYNNFGNNTIIESSESHKYQFVYDDFQRLITVKEGNDIIEEYEYPQIVDKYSKNNLLKITQGNDNYEFDYDENGQVIKKYINDSLISEYEYDELDRLSKLKDNKTLTETSYNYDIKGNLQSEIKNNGDRFNYEYDNLGNIQSKKYNIGDSYYQVEYEYEHELNEYNYESYITRLTNKYNDEIVISNLGANCQYGGEALYKNCVYRKNTDLDQMVFSMTDLYDYLGYDLTTFNSNRKIGLKDGNIDQYENWKNRFYYNKTFYLWIKPQKEYGNTNILTFSRNNTSFEENVLLSHLNVNENGYLRYIEHEGIQKVITTNKLVLNDWNLVGIQFIKTSGKYYCKLTLNGTTTSFVEINEKVEEIEVLLIGYQLEESTSTGLSEQGGESILLKMPFDIVFISGGPYEYTETDFNSIYKEGKKYFNNTINTNVRSTINYSSIYKNFDLVTLNSTLESNRKTMPVSMCNIDNSFRTTKSKMFVYDNEIKRHVLGVYNESNSTYSNKNNLLGYKCDLDNEGSITLRFKAESNSLGTILYICDEHGIVFILYKDESNKLYAMFEHDTIDLNKTIELNKYYQVLLTFKNNKFELYVDDSINLLPNEEQDISLLETTIYIGNDMYKETPLNGKIEMFGLSKNYVNDKVTFMENSKPITQLEYIDDLGKVVKRETSFRNNINTVLYEYEQNRVFKELHNDGIEIEYSYYPNGNIESITTTKDGVSSSTSYEYDEFNRLKSELRNDGSIESYTYENGNLIEKLQLGRIFNTLDVIEKQNFNYDKDRLLSTNTTVSNNLSVNITYDSNYKFKPISVTKNNIVYNITYEGKRIKSFGNINFEYDSNGHRIKKETEDFLYSYIYEGNNLIEMKRKNKVTLSETLYRFMYDYNNMIIGFEVNNDVYFYERDITGNIIGLIDKNNNIVVKYTYDAWGNHKVLNSDDTANNNNEFIGNINPFRFKGYYYDEETQLFYCNSRYYSPELCRWISPDSIEYLDPESINGLNLYAYCGNDPVNRYDPSGHAWDWAQIGRGLIAVGIAAAVVAAVAVITVASGGSAVPVLVGTAIGAGISGGVSLGCQLVSTGEINFGQLLTDMAIGGVSGAFGGSALGKLGMTIAGSVTGFFGSLASDFVETGSMNFSSNQLWKAIGSGVLGGAISFIGGAGAQNGKLGGVLKYSNRLSTITQKGITGDYLNNTVKHLLREKRILINAANQAIYKSIPYTIGTSILDYYL